MSAQEYDGEKLPELPLRREVLDFLQLMYVSLVAEYTKLKLESRENAE